MTNNICNWALTIYLEMTRFHQYKRLVIFLQQNFLYFFYNLVVLYYFIKNQQKVPREQRRHKSTPKSINQNFKTHIINK